MCLGVFVFFYIVFFFLILMFMEGILVFLTWKNIFY
jgi:hypothetical protein